MNTIFKCLVAGYIYYIGRFLRKFPLKTISVLHICCEIISTQHPPNLTLYDCINMDGDIQT